MEVRLAILEQKVSDHITESRKAEKRNEGQHSLIISKLESAMTFQRRLQWVGGTVLLMTGAIAGWVVHTRISFGICYPGMVTDELL